MSVGIAAFLLSVSTIPFLLILYSLMQKMITSNQEATIIDDEFEITTTESESAFQGLLNEEDHSRAYTEVVSSNNKLVNLNEILRTIKGRQSY